MSVPGRPWTGPGTRPREMGVRTSGHLRRTLVVHTLLKTQEVHVTALRLLPPTRRSHRLRA